MMYMLGFSPQIGWPTVDSVQVIPHVPIPFANAIYQCYGLVPF